MANSKFDLMCLGKWRAWERRPVALQSLSTNKKGLVPVISNRMSLFQSFNIVLYLGIAIALPMIISACVEFEFLLFASVNK